METLKKGYEGRRTTSLTSNDASGLPFQSERRRFRVDPARYLKAASRPNGPVAQPIEEPMCPP